LLRSFLPGEEEAGRQMRRQGEAQQQARRAALERDRQRNAALSSEWVRIFDRASSAVRR
jgi:hypothetical protein